MTFQPIELGLFGVMSTGLLLFAFYPDAGMRRRGCAFFLAWFVPGLGHVLLGRWRKGLFFFAVLAALFTFGLWICGWRSVSFEDNPFYYVGRYGCGLAIFLGRAIGGGKAYPRPDLPLTWYDPGLLYVCVAGLLNIIVALGVFEAGKAPAPAKEGAEKEEKEEGEADTASPEAAPGRASQEGA